MTIHTFPQHVFAGFTMRDGQRLAFITSIDSKQQIKSAKSWNAWRDQNIDVLEWENVPTSGFIINKTVQRYGQSKKEYVRIWHPLGFEFEIKVSNFERLMSFVHLTMGEIHTPCVLTWTGGKVYLTSTLDPSMPEMTANLPLSKVAPESLVVTEPQHGVMYQVDGKPFIFLGAGKIVEPGMTVYTRNHMTGLYWAYDCTEGTIISLTSAAKKIKTMEQIPEVLADMAAYLNERFIPYNSIPDHHLVFGLTQKQGAFDYYHARNKIWDRIVTEIPKDNQPQAVFVKKTPSFLGRTLKQLTDIAFECEEFVFVFDGTTWFESDYSQYGVVKTDFHLNDSRFTLIHQIAL